MSHLLCQITFTPFAILGPKLIENLRLPPIVTPSQAKQKRKKVSLSLIHLKVFHLQIVTWQAELANGRPGGVIITTVIITIIVITIIMITIIMITIIIITIMIITIIMIINIIITTTIRLGN